MEKTNTMMALHSCRATLVRCDKKQLPGVTCREEATRIQSERLALRFPTLQIKYLTA